MPALCARNARRSLTAGALVTSLATVCALADEPIELSWQAPPGCPQQAAVRERVRALVPRATLERGRLRADGAITRVGARYRLRLMMRLGDVSGERSIDSDSCGDLAGAAAVALGLLLQTGQPAEADPGSATSAGAAGDAGAGGGAGAGGSGGGGISSDPAAAAATLEASPAPRAAPHDDDDAQRDDPGREGAANARRLRVFAIAPQLAFDVGPLPRPSLALAVGAGLGFQRWELIGGARLPAKQSVGFARALGADLDHFALTLDACRAFSAPPFEVAPCVTAGLERLHASGTGPLESTQSADATWLSLGVQAWGRWYVVDWLAFAVGVGARLESARPRIEIEGISEAKRLGPAALSVRAGPMLVF